MRSTPGTTALAYQRIKRYCYLDPRKTLSPRSIDTDHVTTISGAIPVKIFKNFFSSSPTLLLNKLDRLSLKSFSYTSGYHCQLIDQPNNLSVANTVFKNSFSSSPTLLLNKLKCLSLTSFFSWPYASE
jgi:hypothetical protein